VIKNREYIAGIITIILAAILGLIIYYIGGITR